MLMRCRGWIAPAVVAASLIAAATAAAAPTWERLPAGTTSDITGIEYQSKQRLWFVTADGGIYTRQRDGRFARRFGAGQPLTRIAFQPSGPVGIAVGADGGVFRSADAGQSWAPVSGITGADARCGTREALTAALSVRWAGNDAVYVTAGGQKLLRSVPTGGQPVGAARTWSDVNPSATAGVCKAPFRGTAPLGASDAFATADEPRRAWFVGSAPADVFHAADVTAGAPFQRRAAGGPSGDQSAKRVVGDPARPDRQWAIAVGPEPVTTLAAADGDPSTIQRTTDGWQTKSTPSFTGARPARTAQHDIAYSDGTVVAVGDDGQIETSIDGIGFEYTPSASGAESDWRAVDLAGASQAVVGGAGGTLAFSDNVNALADASSCPPTPAPAPPAPISTFKPRAVFDLPPGKDKGIKPTTKRKTVTISVRGALSVPAGVAVPLACRGNLTITVNTKRKGRVRNIVARKAKVSNRTCAYRKTIRFQRSKVKGRQITVVIEFPGNTVVARNSYRKGVTLKR